MLKKCEFQQDLFRDDSDVKSIDFFGRGGDGAATCPSGAGAHPFSITPSQRALRNFFAPGTPYNGLLLFHGTGAMKTCSAVTICEGFKSRKVFLLARPTLHTNFMRTVHDPSSDADTQCTGGTYLGRANAVGEKYKTFGLIAFANAVAGASDGDLRERFSGSVIVVDEAHQLRNVAADASVHQALQRVVSVSSGVKLLLLTATPMFNSTADIVPLLNLLRLNDRRAPLRASDVFGGDFEELAKVAAGYVSYARGYSPVSFPAMLRPSDAGPVSLANFKPSGGRLVVDESGAPVPIAQRVETLVAKLQARSPSRLQSTLAPVLEIVSSRMRAGGAQIAAYEKEARAGMDDSDYSEDDEDDASLLSGLARQACNVVFPSGLVGRKGFRAALEMDVGTRTWRYRKGVRAFLAPGERACGGHACKIDTIAECVASKQSRNSFKIIYSRWIWSGVLPMAVALEHRGFRLYSDDANKGSVPRYAIISGMREHGDPNRILQVARSLENIRGGLINVLLMTDRGSEGLDFRFVRELHVMEPWFHMKKIEQIVGRASRHCSHSALPLEERNVTIYLHAAIRPVPANRDAIIETADMRAFRTALIKEDAITRAEAALVRASISAPGTQHHAPYDISMMSAQGRRVRVRGEPAAPSDSRPLEYDDSTFDPARHVDLPKLRRRIVERLRMPDAAGYVGCTVEGLVAHCYPDAHKSKRPSQCERWVVASIVAAIRVESPGDGAAIRRSFDRIFLLEGGGGGDGGDREDAVPLASLMPPKKTSAAAKDTSAAYSGADSGPSPEQIFERCEGVKQLIAPYVVSVGGNRGRKTAVPAEIVDFVVDRLGVDEVVGAAVNAWRRQGSSASASVVDSLRRSGVLLRTPKGAFLQSPFPRGGCFVLSGKGGKGGVDIRPCVSGETGPQRPSPNLQPALDDPWVRGGFMDRPPRPASATRDNGGAFVFKLATSDNKRGSVCEQTSALKISAMIAAIERLYARSGSGMRLRPETKNSIPKNVACILMELALRREAPDSFLRPNSKRARALYVHRR